MKKALYCGSFDPFTLGHLAVIEKALSQEYGFEKIIICVSVNPDKTTLFTAEKRVSMIEETLKFHPFNSQIEVTSYNGLIVNLAQKLGITTLIRGLRTLESFSLPTIFDEEKLAQTNKRLALIRGFNLETQYISIEDDFINTISSSLVKRLCSYGEYIDVMKLVPANIHQELMAIYLKPRFINLFFGSHQSTAHNYWNQLVETYKTRSYHNLSHIGYMFNMLDIYKAQNKFSSVEFELAIFGHDYVYNVNDIDNEEQSAKIIINWIGKRFFKTSEYFTNLLLTTKHGNQIATTDEEKLIADLDLSILGTFDEATWKNYCANIRQEYSSFRDEEYDNGRVEFLKNLLNRERIFQTDFFYNSFEEQARQNIKRWILALDFY